MSVSNKDAREGFEKLLKSKAAEFGISLSTITAGSSVAMPYRADSYQYSSVDRETTTSDNTTIYDGTP